MAEGIVFDIQRFCVHDGPGIRTTAFLKGCPLSCRWCHNPESRDQRIQIRYFEEKCFGCGQCRELTGCPPSELAGKAAGEKERAAAEACLGGALALSGKRYTARELVAVLERDRDFYGDLGGVTFSGGEPATQPEFLEEALTLCRQLGLHTTLDTCGYAPWGVYERLLPLCGLVLFDLKGMQPGKHLKGTGRDNKRILDNFRAMAGSGTPMWVRIPLIPEYSGTPEELGRIVDFLEPYREAVLQVTLIPYHSLGQPKYKTLGLVAEEFPQPEEGMAEYGERLFLRRGFLVGH